MLLNYLAPMLLLISLNQATGRGSNPNLESRKEPISYRGGKSTPLLAAINIALADRIPLGVIFGSGQSMCEKEIEYDFTKMTRLDALRMVVKDTGYTIVLRDNVYNLVAPDITERERKAMTFRFKWFRAPSTTMADLGMRLNGYISTSIEGAKGFATSSLGSTDDEIISFNELQNVTSLQVANRIVTSGSRGVWLMHTTPSSGSTEPDSTIFNIFSYHDSRDRLTKISCPPWLQK
jgi:hypothetical protein